MSNQVVIDRRFETRSLEFDAGSVNSSPIVLSGFAIGSVQMPTLAGGASTMKIQISNDGANWQDLVDYETGVVRPADSVSSGSVHYIPTEAFAFARARLVFDAADSATNKTIVQIHMAS